MVSQGDVLLFAGAGQLGNLRTDVIIGDIKLPVAGFPYDAHAPAGACRRGGHGRRAHHRYSKPPCQAKRERKPDSQTSIRSGSFADDDQLQRGARKINVRKKSGQVIRQRFCVASPAVKGALVLKGAEYQIGRGGVYGQDVHRLQV